MPMKIRTQLVLLSTYFDHITLFIVLKVSYSVVARLIGYGHH
jgi:hypothetical protein